MAAELKGKVLTGILYTLVSQTRPSQQKIKTVFAFLYHAQFIPLRRVCDPQGEVITPVASQTRPVPFYSASVRVSEIDWV